MINWSIKDEYYLLSINNADVLEINWSTVDSQCCLRLINLEKEWDWSIVYSKCWSI